MNTTDYTYLRLKYGYPLTKESYSSMPDELVDMIFHAISPVRNDIKKISSRRLIINVELDEGGVWCEVWTKSYEVWNIIENYYATHN